MQMSEEIVHSCQRCGTCCRWEGDVCITEEEVCQIASYLDLDELTFINTLCRLRGNRQGLSLIDDEQGACIMLTDTGCRIQAVKPQQCLDFPHRWRFPHWETRCPGAGIHPPCSPSPPAS